MNTAVRIGVYYIPCERLASKDSINMKRSCYSCLLCHISSQREGPNKLRHGTSRMLVSKLVATCQTSSRSPSPGDMTFSAIQGRLYLAGIPVICMSSSPA